LNSSAIYSKTGKGVQEASGKTSHLSRADRAVLAAIDGKTNLRDVAGKFEKLPEAKFDALILQLDKDGFIREVSSGAQSAPSARPAAPPKAAPPPSAKASSGDDGDGLDFTMALKVPPRAPAAPAAPAAPKAPAPPAPKPAQIDLAATARAGAERKAEEDLTLDYRSREELQAKLRVELAAQAKAEAKAKAEAHAAAEAKAASEAKSRAEAEAKARAEAEAKTHAEADAKVKAAREAALRMATEVKAKAEAEGKAKADAAEREKARIEAELNAKLDEERKARKDLEEKAKRDGEEMRQRLEAEMKAKLDAERKAREEEDRKRREEENRKRKEEDEQRAKEDAERRAREEAERKKREEEDRKRKEDDERRRKEDDARRAKEDVERKAREEEDRRRKEEDGRKAKDDAERRAKEESDRKAKDDAERRAKEESERKAKDDAERRAKEEAERKAKDDAERRGKEAAEAKARTAADAAASLPKIEPVVPPPAAAAPPAGDLGDLLGDLENFGKREEEELKAKEEAERQAKEAAARKKKEDAERRAKEEAERKAKDDAERRAKEEAERKAKEEAEREEREAEERRKEEEAERKRKAKESKEALAARQAAERASKSGAKGGDDVDVKDDDVDMDDIKRDQKTLASRATREQPLSAVVAATGRPRRWGRPVAIAVFALLVLGIGALHVLPVSTAEYEKGASAALGVPVKIGSARMSVITGVELKFENVAIGDAARIRLVRGLPEIGSLFGERKSFSRLELEGVSMGQSQVAGALLGKAAGANFRVGRVLIKELNLDGPLKLPPLDVEATVAGDGNVQTVRLSGPEKLLVQLSPKGGEVAFEISAGSLALPFVPALNLVDFGMKGTATGAGVTSAEFDGRAYEGVISGTARIRWGASWNVEGEIRARAVKVAVFAPALVSEGKADGRATYTMSGTEPGQLYQSARMQGEFKVDKGVLGSFDLTRALQTGGAQSGGRTAFNEMKGQGSYDKGVIQLRDISLTAGSMNAGASVDIDANGGISGRIAADVKTPNQTLRAVLNISGKVQAPVIRK
jgi:hypothetical protein